MLDDMLGAYGNRLTIAVVGVAVGLLCLIVVVWLLRGRGGPAPFLRGGKNRQPRLQVLDAAAVDARRRLVLVRRDDVEHLIMIGGPTDVVIESSIVDGRSPPYHTLMKTVSDPEPVSLGRDEPQPQLPETPRPIASVARTAAPDTAAPARAEPVAPASPAQKVDPQPRAPSATPKPAEAAAPEMVRREPPVQPARTAPESDDFAWVGTTAATVDAAKSEPAATPSSGRMASPVVEAPKPVAVVAAEKPTPIVEVAVPPVTPVAQRGETHMPVAPAAAPAPAPAGLRREPALGELPSPAIEAAAPSLREPSATEPAGRAAIRHDPIIASAPAATPSLDTAADLLDAARERVFQPAPVRPMPAAPVSSTGATPPAPRPTAPAATAVPAKPLGSDFERILEEEMATNLAANGQTPPAAAPSPAMPRREPGLARVTGATQEPALQNEIARIFGEMSVTRDDR